MEARALPQSIGIADEDSGCCARLNWGLRHFAYLAGVCVLVKLHPLCIYHSAFSL